MLPSPDLGSLSAALPMPVVLAGGAGAIIATAARLSARAARHPELPAQRWSRPLPRAVNRLVDAAATSMLLRCVGVLAAVAGLLTLARHDAPVDGLVVIAAVTALSLLAGPAYRLLDPVRAVHAARSAAPGVDRAGLRGATTWLSVWCVTALSTDVPAVLAATGGLVLAQAALPRDGLHRDPLAALARFFGHLAPLGRDRDRRPAWRNPLVAVTHAELPPAALPFGAVVIAASVTHAALDRHAVRDALDPLGVLGPAVAFAAALAVAAAVLRLGVIRPFFRGATVPLVAAYGLLAGGRWWPPVDLLAFVALHVVAVAVLHRQALARHDLRTARALQFPARVVLITSVVSGLALLASS